jgi:acetylornithine/succinyldiaminopimelate/putrescine aminotransferase/predicted amino acid dehydrogenase
LIDRRDEPDPEPPPAHADGDDLAGHIKPLLAAQLRATGLDVVYERGRGDTLTYREADGREVAVLDLVGGFGASLLGHNHPRVVARAIEILRGERPFHAQASLRLSAGRLGRRLCAQVERATGRPAVAHLASTGAEAVEAAIKHAEMERRRRVDRILARIGQGQHDVRRRLRDGSAAVSERLFERACRLFGLSRIEGIDELFLRLYHRARAELDRPPAFLAVEGAFHGKTSGSLKLTHRAEYQAPWRGIGPASAFLPAGDLPALAQALEAATLRYVDLEVAPGGELELAPRELVNVAACFVEPIQGEGGVHEIDREYLRALRAAADRHGFPLVLDEIQSGMGRTGAFFASEHAGVAGDYYLLSKSLGAGLAKISALMVARERYIEEFGVLHTSTFADDDFSSEVALAGLDLIEEDGGALMRRCAEMGALFMGRLRDVMARHPDQIRAVRGRGLMIGVELADQRDSPSAFMRVLGAQELLGFMVSGWFLREHAIRVAPTLSARATIRIEPSAAIEAAAISRTAAALEELAGLLRAGDAYRLLRFAVGRARESAPPPAPRPPAPPATRPATRQLDPSTHERDGARVGFLTHFLTAGDLLDWDPRLAPLDADDCRRFLDRTRGLVAPFVAARTSLRSPLGSRVHATVIGLPFTPDQVVDEMRAGGGGWARELIDQGIELARQRGCAVVGFGGFTSILTASCRSVVASDIALTTGNSLTAAAALEAAQCAAHRLALPRRVLGVVGAIGNIGRVLAEVAADWVDEIVLVGRPGAERRLRDAAAAIYASSARRAGGAPGPRGGLAATMSARGLLGGSDGAADRDDLGEWLRGRAEADLGASAPVRIATDVAALLACDIILTASNAARPVVYPQHVRADRPVVVCDVAVPRDVDDSVMDERPRAAVLAGGVVRAPLGQTFALSGMNLPPGQVYGCLAETLLMGLAGIGENFSYGALDPMRIRRIRDLALMHGFALDENPRRRLPRDPE